MTKVTKFGGNGFKKRLIGCVNRESNQAIFTYLLELLVPGLHNIDDAGVGVEDDERGQVEGAHGRVDHVARVLVVLALTAVAVPVRV